MAKTVVGLFDDFSEAQSAVQDLVNSGFRRDDISITANNARGEYNDLATRGDGDHGMGGAATGAGVGAGLGAVAGLLVGLGALAIPGIGPIVAAGPIAAALAGAGIGAVAGGLIGGLTDLGVPEEEAHHYAEGVRRGGSLVTITADDTMADQAADILNRHGAVDIDSRVAQWRQQGWTGYSADAQPYGADDITRERETWRTGSTATANLTDTQGEVRLPVTEEEIHVGKREVQRGGVRVYTRTEEQPVAEDITLREEHVTVERHAVDRPISTADATAFQDRTIEVTETAEVPVVEKQARVAEEVVVRKDVGQHVETIHDTVRRTDVDVENITNTTTRTDVDVDELEDTRTTTGRGTIG